MSHHRYSVKYHSPDISRVNGELIPVSEILDSIGYPNKGASMKTKAIILISTVRTFIEKFINSIMAYLMEKNIKIVIPVLIGLIAIVSIVNPIVPSWFGVIYLSAILFVAVYGLAFIAGYAVTKGAYYLC